MHRLAMGDYRFFAAQGRRATNAKVAIAPARASSRGVGRTLEVLALLLIALGHERGLSAAAATVALYPSVVSSAASRFRSRGNAGGRAKTYPALALNALPDLSVTLDIEDWPSDRLLPSRLQSASRQSSALKEAKQQQRAAPSLQVLSASTRPA
ncbi:hypothetical protein PC117_g5758 [Phytophthora cactorum]|uniref:Uncharacterized protein n=1 Tax=Phytophthora cactorum TaxID=29920 RepID=A0A8T1EBZ2_9STRA|nr:hypothetical protein PC117_g5758 [Phytophthora cactorum]